MSRVEGEGLPALGLRVGEVGDIADQDLRPGAGHKVVAGDADERHFDRMTGFDGCDVAVIPRELLPVEKIDHLAQRLLPRRIDCVGEQPSHRTEIVFIMCGDARRDHPFLGDHGKIEVVASRLRELVDKGALRAPIALAERVHGVQLGEQIGRPLGEGLSRQPAEITGVAQLGHDLVERSGDVRARDKFAATFALQLGFGRDRPVAEPYFFVPCVAGPS